MKLVNEIHGPQMHSNDFGEPWTFPCHADATTKFTFVVYIEMSQQLLDEFT